MKMLKALGVALVVAGSSMALPAMADPDLEGGIQDGLCPDPSALPTPTPGFVKLLGITVAVPVGTPITADGNPVDCGKLTEGDRIKVRCTDATCATAASIKFDPNSAESSLEFFAGVPSVNGICTDPAPPATLRFQLSSGIVCTLDPTAEVKQPKKKNFLGVIPPASPTQTDLFYFLACAVPGTPGTLEIKCTGYNPLGQVDGTTGVEVKK